MEANHPRSLRAVGARRVVLALVALALAVSGAVALTQPRRPTPVRALAELTPTPTPSPAPTPRPLLRVTSPSAAPAPIAPVVPVVGADVSWPNCPLGTRGALPGKQPKGLGMPGPEAQFVVIGLTNGPGFYPNPCLAAQVRGAQRRHLLTAAYAFTTLPNASQIRRYGDSGPYSTGTALGRVRNAAYAEAQVNVASLRRTGLRTPIVWMDVEPQDYLEPWGTDVRTNVAVIRAAQSGYAQAGYATGFYSAPFAWKPITGDLRDPSPVWVTAGSRGRAEAQRRCDAPSFSGGPVALSQWWVVDVGDHDVTCPRARADVRRFFAP